MPNLNETSTTYNICFSERIKSNTPKLLTIKRAVIVGKNDNKQVKLFPLGLDCSNGIMVLSLQNSFHLIRASSNYWEHRFTVKCLQKEPWMLSWGLRTQSHLMSITRQS